MVLIAVNPDPKSKARYKSVEAQITDVSKSGLVTIDFSQRMKSIISDDVKNSSIYLQIAKKYSKSNT